MNNSKFLYIIFGFASISYHSIEAVEIIDPEIRSQIEDFIQNEYLPRSGVQGLAITIVTADGNITYTNGFGLADKNQLIENGENTQFLIGSITKSITSTIAVKVLHESFPGLGEAVLDTPIRKLMPDLNFTLIDRFRSEHGTFRDLLSHRMCLPSDDLQMAAQPFNSSAEIRYRQRYSEEICGIRSEFQYNNQMYVLAADLLSQLANQSYEDLVKDLLERIGMLNSTLGMKTDDYENLPNRAMPYYTKDNASNPMNTDLLKRLVDSNPAGGLWSTPNDMAKYLQFHLNSGKVDGVQIVPEHLMKWLKRPSMVAPRNNFKKTDEDIVISTLSYGLGLMTATYDGWEYLQHSGYWPSYSSFFSIFPSKGLGIFTSTNEAPILLDQLVLHSFIFEILRDSQNAPERIGRLMDSPLAKPSHLRLQQQVFINPPVGKPTHYNLSDIVGKYGNGASGDIDISMRYNPVTEEDELYMSYGQWGKGWLESYDATNDNAVNFKILWDTDMIQDNYAGGDPTGLNFARVYNETLEFIEPRVDPIISYGKFKLGVTLDTLPPVPWAPESC